MQKLLIQRFGPIQDVEMPVDKDLMLLIGRQAVGKSTLCELIFFFKSLRAGMIDLLYADAGDEPDPMAAWLRQVRTRFTPDMFGPTMYMGHFALKYQYGEGKYIEIRQDVDRDWKGARVILTDRADFHAGDTFPVSRFYGETQRLLDEVASYRRAFTGEYAPSLDPAARREQEHGRQRSRQILEARIDALFEDSREVMYIPASRSLMTSLSESFINTDVERFQHPKYIVNHFLRTIQRIRQTFRQSLTEMIDERRLREDAGSADCIRLAVAAQPLIEAGILRGKYRYRGFDEVLQIGEDQYVRMPFASSGQQEALWITLVIFWLILHADQNPVFIVIEEPEAHLYPVAQKAIAELIALLANANPGHNQVMVTTHSPYILSSFNNLLFAGHVGEKVPEHERPLPSEFWIESRRVDAYLLDRADDAQATNLLSLKDEDPDMPLLQTEAIDRLAVGMILDTYDKIAAYE